MKIHVFHGHAVRAGNSGKESPWLTFRLVIYVGYFPLAIGRLFVEISDEINWFPF
jgi:hypothetical protein